MKQQRQGGRKAAGGSNLDGWYKTIQDSASVTQIAQQSTFDPEAWNKWFSLYLNQGNRDAQRAMR